MQKRKFDELISHFNRKVSDMSIDQKYKMELLGMISAIGFAHEEELGTNLAEVGTDCISRQAACEYCHEDSNGYVMPLEKNCHAFIRYGMNGWELSLKAKGWHGSAKIKYCPICGRSLTHE